MKHMKEVCDEVGITYETLKYYCNEGLVPNHKRDQNNYRIFDNQDIAWIKGLIKLRECNMSIQDMKKYLDYCLQGKSSIEERKLMLDDTKEQLESEKAQIEESLNYIKYKKEYYDKILAGEVEYTSSLLKPNEY